MHKSWMRLSAVALSTGLGMATFGITGVSAATMLADKNGMTLYVFDMDAKGVPSCYDACAKKWPPYLATAGDKADKQWDMVKRKGGAMQWTYDKKPLYFYEGDKVKGDKTGDGLGGKWHVLME